MKALLFLLAATAAFSSEVQWTPLSTSTRELGIPQISRSFLDADKIERVVMPGYFEHSGVGASDYIERFLAVLDANPNFAELSAEDLTFLDSPFGLRNEQWLGI